MRLPCKNNEHFHQITVIYSRKDTTCVLNLDLHQEFDNFLSELVWLPKLYEL